MEIRIRHPKQVSVLNLRSHSANLYVQSLRPAHELSWHFSPFLHCSPPHGRMAMLFVFGGVVGADSSHNSSRGKSRAAGGSRTHFLTFSPAAGLPAAAGLHCFACCYSHPKHTPPPSQQMLRNIASQVVGSRQTPVCLPVAPEAAASGLGGADFKKVGRFRVQAPPAQHRSVHTALGAPALAPLCLLFSDLVPCHRRSC
eukprot:COSAG01_NODE_12835_length_1678_cov_4.310956_2_plen_199_part_00